MSFAADPRMERPVGMGPQMMPSRRASVMAGAVHSSPSSSDSFLAAPRRMSSGTSVYSSTSGMSLFKSQNTRINFMHAVRPKQSHSVLGSWDPGCEGAEAPQEPQLLSSNQSAMSFATDPRMERPVGMGPPMMPSRRASVMSGAAYSSPSSSASVGSAPRRMSSGTSVSSSSSGMSGSGLFKSQSNRIKFMHAVRPKQSHSVLGFWDPGCDGVEAPQEPQVLSSNRSVMPFAADPRMERPARMGRPMMPSGEASVMSGAASASRAPQPISFKSQSVRSNQMQQKHQRQPSPERNACSSINRSINTRPMMMVQQPPEVSSPQQAPRNKPMSASEMLLHAAYAAHAAFESNSSAMVQSQPRRRVDGYASKDPHAMSGRSSSHYMPPPLMAKWRECS